MTSLVRWAASASWMLSTVFDVVEQLVGVEVRSSRRSPGRPGTAWPHARWPGVMPLHHVQRAPEQPLDQRHLALEHVDLAQRSSAKARPSASPPLEDQLLERVDARLDALQRLEIGVDRGVEHLGEQVRACSPSLPAFGGRLGLRAWSSSRASHGCSVRWMVIEKGRARRRSRPCGSAPAPCAQVRSTRSSNARMMAKA